MSYTEGVSSIIDYTPTHLIDTHVHIADTNTYLSTMFADRNKTTSYCFII